uniref:SUEL-type lectin domain-containing protein n=1 Tax=Cyprinus carpio TaxID=7962 RepID=A0A8C1V413_CYPCA
MCFELVFFFFSQYWTVLYVNLSDLVFPYLVYCFYIKIFYELIVSALFNFSETVVTCDGFVQSLSCEHGKIQINTANYGRTDKTTCSQGRPSQQLQNTNCFSPNALDFVSKSCNGLEICEVYATHMIFTDPCFGTYKYLAISYFCLPHRIREYLFHGTVIHIQSANYGRTDSSTCSNGRPPAQLSKTDCYTLNSQTVVASRCEGKSSCSILASNSVFSDPCVGTFKYLNISYSCGSKCKCYCIEKLYCIVF